MGTACGRLRGEEGMLDARAWKISAWWSMRGAARRGRCVGRGLVVGDEESQESGSSGWRGNEPWSEWVSSAGVTCSDLHVWESKAGNTQSQPREIRGLSYPRQDPLHPLVAPLTGEVRQRDFHFFRDLALTTSGERSQQRFNEPCEGPAGVLWESSLVTRRHQGI